MRDQKILLGVILIVIGILWTLSNFQRMNDQWILPLIGAILVIAYFYSKDTQEKRAIGMLIAGCIITMVGLFSVLNDYYFLGIFEGTLFFIFLGIAFLAIYFIHTRYLVDQDSGHQRWPLYTGLIIIAFGLFVLFIETMKLPDIRKIYALFWPLILMILGLYILFFHRIRKK